MHRRFHSPGGLLTTALLLAASPLLMGSECSESEDPVGSDTTEVSMSFKNFSDQPVHLWFTSEFHSNTIGPTNRLEPLQEDAIGINILKGNSRTITFHAGRNGEPLGNPVSVTVPNQARVRYNVDWNSNETLGVRLAD